jgi:hypothetical protein
MHNIEIKASYWCFVYMRTYVLLLVEDDVVCYIEEFIWHM